MMQRATVGENSGLRYEKLENLLHLALEMRGTSEGVSFADIQHNYDVSRRTAERMRDTIERLFPGCEQSNPGELPKRWRIRGSMAGLVGCSAEELAALQTASALMKRENLAEQSARLETLILKLKSLMRPETVRRVGPDLEALMEAEGLALRPGPRQVIPQPVLSELRHAILACCEVWLHYRARGTGTMSRQRVRPYGFLYGNRHYLVAYNLNPLALDYRLFALAHIEKVEVTDTAFERNADFSLRAYAERSFGVYQEEPFDVAWRFSPKAAPDARHFLFHPTQILEDQPDGSLIVRFEAGGALEMSWHLVTWGDEVEVVAPQRLRKMLERAQSFKE